MQIDLSDNGLLKAWMNRKVKKNYCEMMMIVISQQYIPPAVLTESLSVPSLFLIRVPWLLGVLLRCFLAPLPSVMVTEGTGPMG